MADTSSRPAMGDLVAVDDVARRARLHETWAPPSGLRGWLSHVNQQQIGRRFVVTAFAFFVLAGLAALLMRLQLAWPQLGLVSPELYNQLFTVHGTAMMFLFAVPMMEGLAILLLPPMLGAPDMPLPRLNAFGYYVFLIGGIAFFASLFLGMAPNAGWFNYAPLSTERFSPGPGVDVWTTMITFIEVSALTAAVEIILLILLFRAPGMSLSRMPLFAWAALVMAFMIVFAMPAVIVGSVMLAADRLVDTQFFVQAAGGEQLLWQHLFWFFGHPEVYIILIPALGLLSMIVPTFARRPVFGYTAIVLAMVATGFVSFGLWVHHMFATGLPHLGLSFFTAASAFIALPSGVQVFCWIATMRRGRLQLRTPLLFVLGFVFIFVLGGITGVMVAAVPFDLQAHDSYFVVAHFHYVLIGGAVFPVFAAMYYWWPKIAGRMMSERLGRWSFGLVFVGFNVTFFPMHQLGLEGMPRRVYTYLPGQGWELANLVATIGAFTIAAGVLLTIVNAVRSVRSDVPAPADPWGAGTLEWALSSPPPPYNHEHPPIVSGREPLWDWNRNPGVPRPVVVGRREDERESIVTSALDGEPVAMQPLPRPTIIPFLAAVAASSGFIGVIFTPWALVPAGLLSFAAFTAWIWPRERKGRPIEQEAGLV